MDYITAVSFALMWVRCLLRLSMMVVVKVGCGGLVTGAAS